MAINFPSNPSVNDTHEVNGRTYIWTGEKWRRRRPRIEYAPPTMDVSNDFTAGSALKVDSDNSSVGIGTMTPNADDALTVGGDTTVDGHINIYNSLTVGASASITGNLSVSGDILSPSFTGIPTAPTATAGTNTTQLATTGFVSTAVADLINSAPTALNTLDELAAALGDDANFASTITNSISLKQDASTALTTSTTFGGDVSGTYNNIVIADDSHNHTIANIDNLQTALDGKAASSHTHSYASTSHNHDSLYYKRDGTYTTSDILTFQSNDNMATSSGSQGALQVYQDNAGADAFMTFHVSGDYACYFGLDGGINDIAVGGWSMGAASYRVYHAGNSNKDGVDWTCEVLRLNEGRADSGSASDPSYTFQDDQDLGIYRQASNSLGITTGNVQHYWNSAGIYLASGDWFRSSGTAGWYAQSYGGGWFMQDTSWVRVYNSKHLYTNGGKFEARHINTSNDWSNQSCIITSSTDHGYAARSYDGDAHTGQIRPASGAFYVRNHNDGAYWYINAIISNQSSIKLKQDIETWGVAKPLSSAVNVTYDTTATDLVKQLRPVTYRLKKHERLPRDIPNKRRHEALKRLNQHKIANNLEQYSGEEAIHECGRDCEGSPDSPCAMYANWERGTIGFIAEEVGSVIPEATDMEVRPRSHNKGDNTAIDGLAMTAVLTKAFQEMEARIAELESRLG